MRILFELFIFADVKQDSYLTLKKSGTGEYKSKGSKFFSYAYRVETENDVKAKLDSIRKEHFKSRHVCYAYRLDVGGLQFRANDDGEPSGTAGLPIMNVLKSHDLVKTLIAVVRYFGGTKLGIAGLIEAYKTSAQDAIRQTTIQEEFTYQVLKLEFPYDELGNLMNYIAKSDFIIMEQSYEEQPWLQIGIRTSFLEKNVLSLYSQLLDYDIQDLGLAKGHAVKYTLLDMFEGRL